MMTPHKSSGRGTFRLDKTVRGVGRLALATGTTDPRQFARYAAMVDALAAAGRLDLLRSLRARTISVAELWDAYRPTAGRADALNRLPTPETLRRLWGAGADEPGALEAWAAAHDVGPNQRRLIRTCWRALRAHARAGATVADLPAALAAYRAACRKAGTPAMFNKARSNALEFLKATAGRYHHLTGAVAELERLGEARKPGHPMSPDEARSLCAALGPDAGAALWALCVTGMRPGELWGRWELHADRVHVAGTKTRSAVRDVPLVEPIAVPRLSQHACKQRLWRHTGGAHALYDGRRTFAHWLEMARVPRSRRMAYLGHAASDVTALYERHEVTRFLAEDAAALRAYLGITGGPARALEVVR